jgi:hypothetical protein
VSCSCVTGTAKDFLRKVIITESLGRGLHFGALGESITNSKKLWGRFQKTLHGEVDLLKHPKN